MQAYDPKAIENSVRKCWEKHNVAGKLAKRRKGSKKFFLLDGPPYINAPPHIGHVKTTVSKDIWTKFRYMQGFNSLLQPGFDCHGLPVEVMVEKELGIKSKKEIEEMGLEKFDELCLQKILNNEKLWIEYYKLVGAWRGYFEPYFTYKNYYIESAWWTLKKIHERGMLVEGDYPIHWCPHCETALSGYEVSDSYKMVSDPSIYLKFKVKGKDNEFLIVWTTTPWTLAGNVAVFVHPDEYYVKARMKSDRMEFYVLAEKRAHAVLGEILGLEYEIVERFKGAELEGLEYEPILDVESQRDLGDKAHRVYLSITIMKKKQYKKHKMSGREGKGKGDEARGGKGIAERSAEEGMQARPETDASEGWKEYEEFVTMGEGSGLVHCAPGHGSTDYFVGEYYKLPVVSPVDEKGCFTEKVSAWKGRFVKDADQEILERLEREGKLLHHSKVTHSYPLCWRCKSPLIFRLSKQWYLKIGPIKEHMLESNESIKWLPPYGKESFRNWLLQSEDWCISQQRYWGIPLPIWICGRCGRKRVVESVMELKENAVEPIDKIDDLHKHTVDKIRLRCDCGGETKRIPDIFNVWYDSGIAPWASLGYPFKNKELFESMYPVDMVNESQDQIRGWFYTLMFCGMAAFGKTPYKTVAMMGWVLDEHGEKMSKSLGNVIYAKEGIEKLGADVLRLYFCWEIAPWDIQKFSFKSAEEVKKSLNILWNAYQFFKTYSRDSFKAKEATPERLEDLWMFSRLNSTAKAVAMHLEEYELHHAGRALVNFILDDFSRWYIKLARDRVSPYVKGRDKEDCLNTIYTVLMTTAKLLAPITPFLSEYIYQDLRKHSKKEKEESVHFTEYPLVEDGMIDAELEELMKKAMLIREAVNSARQEEKIKLRWPLRELIVSGDSKTERTVEVLQGILCSTNNVKNVLFSDSPPPNLKEKAFEGGKVFFSPKRDEELINESFYRELIRSIQEARKTHGFNVTESISLSISADEAFSAYLESRKNELKKEVGAKAIRFGKLEGEFSAEIKLDDKTITARFSRVKR
ncbi:isoleucine--tRNA ligase [Candidatus Micrarchaeota archaeon]|nr:isoleucine--tRNA ligase [Candidatus Micrarchaeota archaeon]